MKAINSSITWISREEVMGCICPKTLLDDIHRKENIDSACQDLVPYQLTVQPVSYYDETLPSQTPPPLPPPVKRRSIQILSSNQSRVQLHTPIYVAVQSYSTNQNGHLSFDEGDEMELIEELSSGELRVNHPRSNHVGIIQKNFVRLDPTTPLRLAVNDRGIINRCIMQYNVLGAYLIRRSQENPTNFVLSIHQINEERNTFQWHYLIRIESVQKLFHFPDENKLNHIYFSSFRQLVADQHVRAVIPLTDILPYKIDFDEELWSIPWNELSSEEKMDEGGFGEVFRAQWRRDQTIRQVAVRKIRIQDITQQIEAMKTLNNLYIVSLYGVSKNPNSEEFFLVTEYMENGDLKSWLRTHPELLDQSTLLRFARHIAHGMAYLEQRNYVHRDLACRNILVSSNANVVKIAGFGLVALVNLRDVEQCQEAHSQKLTIRWSAPEVLSNKANYSTKSDVWSFGILLIELWLKGEIPYGRKRSAYVMRIVKNGFVHERPMDCPEDFYQSIICQCLRFKPNDRPSFDRLIQVLDQWQFSDTSTQYI